MWEEIAQGIKISILDTRDALFGSAINSQMTLPAKESMPISESSRTLFEK